MGPSHDAEEEEKDPEIRLKGENLTVGGKPRD